MSAPQACYSFNVPGAPIYETTTVFDCPASFYCPNSTASNPQSFPQYCPPSFECINNRTRARSCIEQGLYEPIVCPPGFYCPTDKTKITCPQGHFCPTGSVEPTKCLALASCPEGSKFQTFFGGIAISFAIDGILLLLFLFSKRQSILFWFQQKLGIRNTVHATGPFKTKESVALASQALLDGYNRAFTPKNSHGEATFPKIDLQFRNLGLTLPSGKTILKNVSGSIKSGRVTAILGGSGAGKTTFLNVLLGKVKRTSGQVFINGAECELHKLKKIVGFVPQDDTCLPQLYVRENIMHSADVRLPTHWTFAEKSKFVDAVIDLLGLMEVAKTPVGSEGNRQISGGQLKRVNIGMELAAAPLALYLDEPTSGLDATSALAVCDILKSIANLGVTVVTVIHQPRYEIFEKFDDVFLLAPGGETAYFGPRESVENYFADLGYQLRPNQNLADLLVDALNDCKNNPALDKKVKQFSSNQICETIAENSTFKPQDLFLVKRGASFLRQLYLCHNRSIKQQSREPFSLVLENSTGLLSGLVMGLSLLSFNGEIMRGLYIEPFDIISPSPFIWITPFMGLLVGLTTALSGAPAAVKTFGLEKTIYWREAASGHSRLAYYLGKTISVVYRFSLSSLHYVSIFYVLSKIKTEFLKLWAIIFMQFFCVYGLSAVVSAFTRRENAALLAVLFCVTAGFFNGFGPTLKRVKSWGLLFIWELSYTKWSTEAFFSEELRPFENIYQIQPTLDRYGYTYDRFGMAIGIMFTLGMVYRIIAYLLMVYLKKEKQR